MSERWLPVVDHEGLYEVSDHGNVRSLPRQAIDSIGRKYSYKGRALRYFPQADLGHLYLRLRCRNGEWRGFSVHRLVLSAFVGACPKGMEGCHNDGNPANNHLSNLRWDTPRGNAADKVLHGTAPYVNKVACPIGHPLAGANLVEWHQGNGHRGCLACARARALVRNKKHQDCDHETLAHREYERIITGDLVLKMRDRMNCPRGHGLEEPNLVRASLARGRRDCLACSRARATIRHRPGLEINDVAHEHYEKIVRVKARIAELEGQH